MTKKGFKWSEARKQRIIGKNNPMFGVRRFGKDNPNFGKKHPGIHKGKKHTLETKMIIKEKRRFQIMKRGEDSHLWKGDSVGYSSLHQWVRTRKPQPLYCEICRINKSYDLANISRKYKRDLNDWWYLCRSCHRIYDHL